MIRLKKPFNGYISCDKELKDANTVLFGVPYDGTTSYRPGARFGPKSIRNESFGIESYSIYQDKDLEDANVFDYGDLDIPVSQASKVIKEVKDFTSKLLLSGKTPIMIGGEHLISLGAVKALAEKHPNLTLIHFDAHADLREDYLGEKLSHACVIRRCIELSSQILVYQFCIRSADKQEVNYAKENIQVNMQKYNFENLGNILNKIADSPIYLTIDLDCLDPSVLPGTGTPEPGGVSFKELREAVTMVASQGKVVGADIVELNPMCDHSGVSTIVAAKLLRESLLALNK